MTSFLRKRYFVRPFQKRLVLFQATYFTALIAALYFSLIAPLFAAVQNTGLAFDERVSSAEALLLIDRRVLPFCLPLLLLLFVHSVLISHRIAGPLYRFGAILRSLAAGDLSMRVRIRQHDYLQDECALLDAAVDTLRQRLSEIRSDARTLDQALAEVESRPTGGSVEAMSRAREAAEGLKAKLEAFTLEAPAPLRSEGQADAPPGREAA
jgi:methyl-accepting chemotaxis protein